MVVRCRDAVRSNLGKCWALLLLVQRSVGKVCFHGVSALVSWLQVDCSEYDTPPQKNELVDSGGSIISSGDVAGSSDLKSIGTDRGPCGTLQYQNFPTMLLHGCFGMDAGFWMDWASIC